MTRCADARAARTIWASKSYPATRNWYAWPDGRHNYAGGTFHNRERQLPARGTYQEFDVYPRARGAQRDAYRIVVDRTSGVTWFSPNHYRDFHRL
jgi:guanyl-specific ribonuclease Sa